jgi:DNA-directed RNA polymerase subunit RPC12/RpoP
MAYKCLSCGHIFEEGEETRWNEKHGFDNPPYEEFSGCPLCKGNFEETKQCKICGGEFLEDELNGGCVCDDCVEEYKRDLEICYKIAETASKEEIKINPLLVSAFDITEIEEILYQQLESVGNNNDFSAFINEDKDWFAEKLEKEVSK